MRPRKILFPSDFSSTGDEALNVAAALARQYGAPLLIAHVEEPPLAYGDGAYYYGIPEPDPEAMRVMLEKVVPRDRTVSYEHRLVDGDPAAAIVGLAKKEGVDLIVMSSHGRTGLSRLLMGSVAEKVMRRAECPVLIVKPMARVAAKAAMQGALR